MSAKLNHLLSENFKKKFANARPRVVIVTDP